MPIVSSSGRCCSSRSASPPTMIVSFPSAAAGVPPLTGASSTRTPSGASSRSTSSRLMPVAVVISISVLPGEKPSRRPLTPRTTSFSSASAGSIVMTTSACRATSAGVATSAAPRLASASAGSRRLWKVVKTGYPAFTTHSAMGAPMAPNPINPIFTEVLSFDLANISWQNRSLTVAARNRSRAATRGSECYLQAELDDSLPAVSTGQLAESGTRRSRIRRHELRVIQCVNELGTKLDTEPFLNRYVFDRRYVQVIHARGPNLADRGRHRDDVGRELLAGNSIEGADVKPLANAALAGRQDHVRHCHPR